MSYRKTLKYRRWNLNIESTSFGNEEYINIRIEYKEWKVLEYDVPIIQCKVFLDEGIHITYPDVFLDDRGRIEINLETPFLNKLELNLIYI